MFKVGDRVEFTDDVFGLLGAQGTVMEVTDRGYVFWATSDPAKSPRSSIGGPHATHWFSSGRQLRLVTDSSPSEGEEPNPIKSYIDNEHGVEWIPLKSVGWPKRMVVLRQEAGVGRDKMQFDCMTRLKNVSEYFDSPIRVIRRDQDLSSLRAEVDELSRV